MSYDVVGISQCVVDVFTTMRTLTVLLLMVLVIEISSEGSLFDKLTSGFKLAGHLLGFDRVSELTQIVSNVFSTRKRQEQSKIEEENVFSGFLRIFGFDSKKIAAVGVNGMIFLAQLISSSLTNTPHKETPRENEEDPLVWISTASGIQHILEHSKNSDLAQTIIEYIKERSLDEDTGCIQLLICKVSPFVKNMQKYLKNPEKGTGKSELFKHIPSMEEIETAGELCEEKHPYCRVIYYTMYN